MGPLKLNRKKREIEIAEMEPERISDSFDELTYLYEKKTGVKPDDENLYHLWIDSKRELEKRVDTKKELLTYFIQYELETMEKIEKEGHVLINPFTENEEIKKQLVDKYKDNIPQEMFSFNQKLLFSKLKELENIKSEIVKKRIYSYHFKEENEFKKEIGLRKNDNFCNTIFIEKTPPFVMDSPSIFLNKLENIIKSIDEEINKIKYKHEMTFRSFFEILSNYKFFAYLNIDLNLDYYYDGLISNIKKELDYANTKEKINYSLVFVGDQNNDDEFRINIRLQEEYENVNIANTNLSCLKSIVYPIIKKHIEFVDYVKESEMKI